jgi:DNA-directed RNA polymerase subunit beta'
MGAEAIMNLLKRMKLDELSYDLKDKANTETSQQSKE